MRNAGVLLVALGLALVLACGSSSSTTQDGLDGAGDAGVGETGGGADDATGNPDATVSPDGPSGTDGATATDGDASPDGSDASGGLDSSSDVALADVYGADGGCACEPYWCGCGTCDPSQIACDISPPVCARGCASSCAEIAQTTCTCDQGRCVRGGIDASSIGCVQDLDCPVGDCCARAQGKGFCATAPNTCCTVACP